MRAVVLAIPKQHYPQFRDDLRAWEKATGKDARWTLGDVANPMQKTNDSSPVTLTCQVNETFFEQFPGWTRFVIT